MDKITVTDITGAASADNAANDNGFGKDQVSSGREICLHFELSLPNGEIIDSNFSAAPATFRVGDGNLLPGFEQALFGLRAGDEHTALINTEDAFGPWNEDNWQKFPRYRFPADLAMEEGLVINFADSAGNDQAGVITKFDASHVTVDFNHPLAGRDIHFRVKILSVTA